MDNRHVQVRRGAFSYGDVEPGADLRVNVDLRLFGKRDITQDNYVTFSRDIVNPYTGEWRPGVTDSNYGMW